MSSKSLGKNFKGDFSEETDSDKITNFGNFVIPFSKVHSNNKEEFIYLGHERIPFNNRHPAYQLIFRGEFTEALRKSDGKIRIGSSYIKFSTSF